LDDVTLFAEVDEGAGTRKVKGESIIPTTRLPIERVYLQPDEPHAFPPAIQAILNADLIVAGPGSLYTSIIPNLLVTEIVKAIRASAAPKIYVCNVATQPGETDGYTVDDHIQAIEAHTVFFTDEWPVGDLGDGKQSGQPRSQPAKPRLFDFVLANNRLDRPIPASMNLQPVSFVTSPGDGYRIIAADVVDEQHPWRHDSTKLAETVMAWLRQQRQ
jgi:hypothetical protein